MVISSKSNNLTNQKKLPLIQTFRGVAALLILFHHGTGQMVKYFNFSYLDGVFDFAWFGVDFFFVLSGFIIYYIHKKDIGHRDRVFSYIRKRALRIYPPYWIITILIAPIYFFTQISDAKEKSLMFAFKSIVLFPQQNTPIVFVGWTLVYEVFFYFVFALAIIMKPKLVTPIITTWVIFILLNLANLIDIDGHFYLKFILSKYNIEFLLGCLSAHLLLNTKIKYSIIYLTLGVFGIVMSWYGAFTGIIEKGTSVCILSFGISAALIILGSAAIDTKYSFKIPRLFTFLGDSSYSLYLTHFYTVILLQKIALKFDSINPFGIYFTTNLVLVVSLLSGCMFYIFVEKPLLLIMNRPRTVKQDMTVPT